MFTLTEELVAIPPASVACICDGCGAVVYYVPRAFGGNIPVDIPCDEEHRHPRHDSEGAGRPHLAHCFTRRR